MKKIYCLRWMSVSILSFSLGAFLASRNIGNLGYLASAIFAIFTLWLNSYDEATYQNKNRGGTKR